MMKQNLGEIIKYKRLELKIKQEDLCEGICTPSYYSRIENNRVQASEEVYQLLFKKLGLHQNPSEIFEQDNQRLEEIYETILKRGDITPELSFIESYLKGSSPLYTKALMIHCRYLITQNELDEARDILKTLKKTITYEHDPRVYFMYLNTSIVMHVLDNSHQEAGDLIRQIDLIKVESFASSRYEKAVFYYNLGLLYEKLYRFKQSLVLIHKAKEIFNDSFSLEQLLSCNILLGILYNNLNDFTESEKYYEFALNMIQYVDKKHQLYYKNIITNNMGYVKEKNEDYAAAISYYMAAIRDDLPEKENLLSYINLAQCYMKLNEMDQARNYLRQVKLLSDEKVELKVKYQIALLEVILSEEPIDSKEISIKIEESLVYFLKNEHWTLIVFYCTYLADLYERQAQYKMATKLLRHALRASSILYERS